MSEKKAEKPIILVSGATGQQGGSVVRYLLKDGGFRVRALTRDTKSQKAAALVRQGVEVVAGDLKDWKSLDAALVGAHGFFINTQFWEKCTEEEEFEQGSVAVAAAAAANTPHVLLSTLPGAFVATGNKLKVPHLDQKWRIALLLQATGLTYTLLFVPNYMDGWGKMLKPSPGPDGKSKFTIPMGGKRFGMSQIADLGIITTPIFKDPAHYNGKLVDLATQQVSMADLTAIYNRTHGTEVGFYEPAWEDFAKYPFPMAHELGVMFAFFQWIADRRIAEPCNPYAPLGIRASDYILVDIIKQPLLASLEAHFLYRKLHPE